MNGAVVHYLTKPTFAPILLPNPYIEKVLTLRQSLWQTISMLRDEHYDAVVDLHHNQRTWFIKMALGVPHYSFQKLNFEKWLLTHLSINWLPKGVHIVDRYLATLQQWGIHNDGKGLDYFVPTEDQIDITSFFPHTKGQPYLAVAIGAAHATKRLPTDKLIELCKKTLLPIILLGGKDDAPTGQIIAHAAGEHVVSACGQFNLHRSAWIVKQAQALVTPDTGLMHIAAAFDQHIISVWGSTTPDFGMYPYLPLQNSKGLSHIVQVNSLSCRPCSKIGYDVCPKGHFRCMNDLNMSDVLDL